MDDVGLVIGRYELEICSLGLNRLNTVGRHGHDDLQGRTLCAKLMGKLKHDRTLLCQRSDNNRSSAIRLVLVHSDFLQYESED